MKKNRKTGIAASIALVVMIGTVTLISKNFTANAPDKNAAGVQVETEHPDDFQEEKAETAGEVKKTEESAELPAPDKSVYMDASQDIEVRIDALMVQMTLEEKVAQMVQPEQASITLSDIAEYNVGSVLSGGGSAPRGGNTVIHWQNNVDNLKYASITQTRLGIPLLYGVDAVHGHNNVFNATVFPHNIGLGAADDEELMERIGAATAREVRATGIQWTFAPTLGNARNELWGRTYECYGEDTDLVTRLGAAYVRGLQGMPGTDTFLDADHVLATAKHYIGEGYTAGGQNQGDVVMDETEFEKLLYDSLLDPYKAVLDEGTLTVMVSYNSVNGVKCHENAYLINDVLKGELGFKGLVVSDYNGVQQVSGSGYKDKVARGVNAGIDLFMEPNDWQKFMDALVELVNEGKVSRERVDDAVRRILRVKFEAGLFEETVGAKREAELIGEFGGEENRAVAREAVRKSLVLLKNDNVGGKTAMEALGSSKNILVAGRKADDIGVQCGGWTISWQGGKGDITGGTTLLTALQNAADGKNIVYSEDGKVSADTDAVIVAVGEDPYAETQGDSSFSDLTVTNEDKKMLGNLKASLAAAGKEDIPVIAVLFTGRPVTIADYVEDFDAIVAAWLPGTEGDGIADVLLGDYDFTGTLTYTWPWYASDIESKFDKDSEEMILFKKGTGFTKSGSSL